MKSSKTSVGGHCCEHCGKSLINKCVDVYRKRHRRHVLIQRVPALVCHECGYRVFEADAVETMEYLLNRPIRKGRKAQLTVLTA